MFSKKARRTNIFPIILISAFFLIFLAGAGLFSAIDIDNLTRAEEPLRTPPPAPGTSPEGPPAPIDTAQDPLPDSIIETLAVGGEIGSIWWEVTTEYTDGSTEVFEEGRQPLRVVEQLTFVRSGKEIQEARFTIKFDLVPGLSVDTVETDYTSKLYETGAQYSFGRNFIANIDALTNIEDTRTTITVPFADLQVSDNIPLQILTQAKVSMVVFTEDGNRYLIRGVPSLLAYDFEVTGLEVQELTVQTEETPTEPASLDNDQTFQLTGIISNPTRNCGGVSCVTGNEIVWKNITYCKGQYLGQIRGVHQCSNGVVSTSVGEEDLPGFLDSIAAAGYEVAEIR